VAKHSSGAGPANTSFVAEALIGLRRTSGR
jgi:hypothetical protein